YQPAGGTEVYGYDGTIHTATGRLDWRLGKHQTINAGFEIETENYYGRTVEPLAVSDSTADVSQRNTALFVQDQFHLAGDRLQIAASYRAQFFSLCEPSFHPASSPLYAGVKLRAPPNAVTWDVSGAYLF